MNKTCDLSTIKNLTECIKESFSSLTDLTDVAVYHTEDSERKNSYIETRNEILYLLDCLECNLAIMLQDENRNIPEKKTPEELKYLIWEVLTDDDIRWTVYDMMTDIFRDSFSVKKSYGYFDNGDMKKETYHKNIVEVLEEINDNLSLIAG